jgi:hypothetical protein
MQREEEKIENNNMKRWRVKREEEERETAKSASRLMIC